MKLIRYLLDIIAHEIASQANNTIGRAEQPRDVYDEDVELIIMEGKYYYLPKTQTADVANEDWEDN